MKIAVLAPPEIPLPVEGYGGIELVAQDFAEELSKSHEVTLFCTRGDTQNAFPRMVVSEYPRELGPVREQYDYTFDFTHTKPLSKNYRKENYAATSFLTDRASLVNDVFPTRAVKAGFPNVPGPVIYPGIKDRYARSSTYKEDREDYLLFLGRISPFKRPDIAIQVGRLTERHVVVAGHVGKYSSYPDPGYADRIRAMCETSEYAVLDENPSPGWKADLLALAAAVVIPSDWSMIGSQESFGIVAVEALLSGTPVITSGDGGLKEIVTPKTGFVCHSLQDYIDAVGRIDEIKPEDCLERGAYFTVGRMSKEYMAYAESGIAAKPAI